MQYHITLKRIQKRNRLQQTIKQSPSLESHLVAIPFELFHTLIEFIPPKTQSILGKTSLSYEDLLTLPRPFTYEVESIGSHLILSSAHRYVGSGTAKPKTKGHKKRGLLQRILQYLRAKLLGKGLSLLEEAHGRWLRDPSHDLEIRLLTLLPNTEELKPYALLLEGLSWRSLESREKLLRYKCPFCSLCNACLQEHQRIASQDQANGRQSKLDCRQCPRYSATTIPNDLEALRINGSAVEGFGTLPTKTSELQPKIEDQNVRTWKTSRIPEISGSRF